MSGVPSFAFNNRFASLNFENDNCFDDLAQQTIDTPIPPASMPPSKRTRKGWERKLPARYTIAAAPGANSLHLPLEIESTDNAMKLSLSGLIDCGATSDFIDSTYVASEGIPIRRLSQPIPVFNVDGTPNEAGSIREVADLVLRYKTHSEHVQLAVTRLGKEKLILGYSWLRKHNPEINWDTREVKMTRCLGRGCSGCVEDLRADRRANRARTRTLRALREGPLPAVCPVDIEEREDKDLPDLEPDNDPDDNEDEPLEQGDRVFYTCLAPPENIRATATVSQRLAEAFARNHAPQEASLPDWMREFEDVFNKDSFDTLPERRTWDHAIELAPDSKPANCKVYPISPLEQKELDAFIEEGLATGRIRPSKSPMASPVFFVKKKDGGLRFVQDYRALNAMTVKNRYPLPLINDLINRLKGARYFTKLDVRWGFNNVRIREGDEWKAAFRTNRGLFEPLVMYFGLTNSPATFQTMMNDIFQDLILSGDVMVYLDDILIAHSDL